MPLPFGDLRDSVAALEAWATQIEDVANGVVPDNSTTNPIMNQTGYKKLDADLNGAINLTDASLVRSWGAGSATPTSAQLTHAIFVIKAYYSGFLSFSIGSNGGQPMSSSLIANEFLDSRPHGLSEFYRDGGKVTPNNTKVPTSGAIDYSDFYGAIRRFFTYTGTHTSIVKNDGYTYFYITGSGTINCASIDNCEYAIIAGGGGSGISTHAGGGGAGGVIDGTINLDGTYPVVIGSGGLVGYSPDLSDEPFGSNGGNSSAFGFTAIGGGLGGSARLANLEAATAGADGGSGGGGGATKRASNFGGSGIPGQGNNGGRGVRGRRGNAKALDAGGGGGGYSSAGTDGTTRQTSIQVEDPERGGTYTDYITAPVGGSGGNGFTWVDGITYAGGGAGLANPQRTGSKNGSPGTGQNNYGGGGQFNNNGNPGALLIRFPTV